MIRIYAFAIALSFLFQGAGAGQNDFYVDPAHPAADDQNPGTAATLPWASLAPLASHALGPGDRLLLRADSTIDGPLILSHSGSAASPICIQGFGSGGAPRLRAPLGATSAVELDGASHCTIRGLIIEGGVDTVHLRNASHIEVLDCEIRNAGRYGLLGNIGGEQNLVRGCYIHNTIGDAINASLTHGWLIENNTIWNVTPVFGTDGVAFHDCSASTSIVRNNRIYGPFGKSAISASSGAANLGSRVDAYSNYLREGLRYGIVAGAQSLVRSWNNVIVMPSNGFVPSQGAAIAAVGGGRHEAFNNTVINSSTLSAPSFFSELGGEILARNNISSITEGVGSSALHWVSDSSCLVSASNNLYSQSGPGRFLFDGQNLSYPAWSTGRESASVVADPGFVGSGSDLFSTPIAQSSAGIDAGVDLSAIFDGDHFGAPRSQGNGWDIGAHEFDPLALPLDGSDEGLGLWTRVDGLQNPESTRKVAFAWQELEILVYASDPSRLLRAPLLLANLYFPAHGALASHAGFPVFHLYPNQVVFLLNGPGNPFGMIRIPVTGIPIPFLLPDGLQGSALRLQLVDLDLSASNGAFAASDAHDIVFL